MISTPIVRGAPAKVNLAVHVTGRRADGYHLLESLVVFARFGDRISVSNSQTDAISVSGPFAAAVPMDDGNLVVRARDRLRDKLSRHGPVSISLEKNLPAASGIGGGSSDAAATLVALARQWGAVTDDTLMRVAEGLGADVPMCLVAQPLIARGIGHDLEPLGHFPVLQMVLVNPGVAVSTPEVFRALSSRDNPPLPPLPRDCDPATVLSWLGAARNDLEAPAVAIAPRIGAALCALRNSGAAFARMSGSGATCFGIFETEAAARRAAASIGASQPSWFVVSTYTTAPGGGFDG